MRTRARSSGSSGRRAGSGQRSSMYSRMTVESNSAKPSVSTSAGTSPRGLASAKLPEVSPLPIASGRCASNSTPFSMSAIFTFWPYGERGWSYTVTGMVFVSGLRAAVSILKSVDNCPRCIHYQMRAYSCVAPAKAQT
jgi:hypothetical protein